MKRYLLIDGNNITHAAQSMKKLTVGEIEVQAVYGFLRQIRKLIARYPILKPIVLWDGASWRNMQFPEYKENREECSHWRVPEPLRRTSVRSTAPISKVSVVPSGQRTSAWSAFVICLKPKCNVGSLLTQ